MLVAKKIICLGTLVLLLFCCTSGCWLNEDTGLKSWEDWVKVPVKDTDKSSPSNKEGQKDPTLEDLVTETITVDLYFARSNGSGLEAEKREIAKEEGIGRKTVEELLAGPRNPDLKPALPEGTKLLDINVKPDGLCIVDFNHKIKAVKSAEAEILAVYSVVNTLTQFPTVERVSFMVEGNPVETLAGHVDLSHPLEADYEVGRESR